MTPGGRLSAAIEILGEVLDRHRPAAEAARDWGHAHRFAGSGDRAAISNLVNAALRRRLSAAWLTGAETPRALALGALRLSWQQSVDEIAAAADGGRFSPPPLEPAERSALDDVGRLADAPFWVRGDIPAWLAPSFEATFGARAGEEGKGLAGRAPLDLRANTLKSDRDRVLKSLARHGAGPTPWSPLGIRIAVGDGPGRLPHVESDTGHGRGHFEVQDEGSQLAALLAGARPGDQVVDYCAGAGGKTLLIAAAMNNTGQVYAHDRDERRLRPIFERLRRAGARNVQVRAGGDGLAGLEGRADIVLLDAPCSGSGVWRRRPDAKWRLTPRALEARQAEQAAVLAEAAPLVRPGGRLVYVTCSVLGMENGVQLESFMDRNSDFELTPWRDSWRGMLEAEPPPSADGGDGALLLTPASHGTDGFFVAVMRRR